MYVRTSNTNLVKSQKSHISRYKTKRTLFARYYTDGAFPTLHSNRLPKKDIERRVPGEISDMIIMKLPKYPVMNRASILSKTLFKTPKYRFSRPRVPIVIDLARSKFTVQTLKDGTVIRDLQGKMKTMSPSFSISVRAPDFNGSSLFLRRSIDPFECNRGFTNVSQPFSKLKWVTLAENRFRTRRKHYSNHRVVGANCCLAVLSYKSVLGDKAIVRKQTKQRIVSAFTDVVSEMCSPLLFFDVVIRPTKIAHHQPISVLKDEIRRCLTQILHQAYLKSGSVSITDSLYLDGHEVGVEGREKSLDMTADFCSSIGLNNLNRKQAQFYIHPLWVDTGNVDVDTPLYRAQQHSLAQDKQSSTDVSDKTGNNNSSNNNRGLEGNRANESGVYCSNLLTLDSPLLAYEKKDIHVHVGTNVVYDCGVSDLARISEYLGQTSSIQKLLDREEALLKDRHSNTSVFELHPDSVNDNSSRSNLSVDDSHLYKPKHVVDSESDDDELIRRMGTAHARSPFHSPSSPLPSSSSNSNSESDTPIDPVFMNPHINVSNSSSVFPDEVLKAHQEQGKQRYEDKKKFTSHRIPSIPFELNANISDFHFFSSQCVSTSASIPVLRKNMTHTLNHTFKTANNTLETRQIRVPFHPLLPLPTTSHQTQLKCAQAASHRAYLHPFYYSLFSQYSMPAVDAYLHNISARDEVDPSRPSTQYLTHPYSDYSFSMTNVTGTVPLADFSNNSNSNTNTNTNTNSNSNINSNTNTNSNSNSNTHLSSDSIIDLYSSPNRMSLIERDILAYLSDPSILRSSNLSTLAVSQYPHIASELYYRKTLKKGNIDITVSNFLDTSFSNKSIMIGVGDPRRSISGFGLFRSVPDYMSYQLLDTSSSPPSSNDSFDDLSSEKSLEKSSEKPSEKSSEKSIENSNSLTQNSNSDSQDVLKAVWTFTSPDVTPVIPVTLDLPAHTLSHLPSSLTHNIQNYKFERSFQKFKHNPFFQSVYIYEQLSSVLSTTIHVNSTNSKNLKSTQKWGDLVHVPSNHSVTMKNLPHLIFSSVQVIVEAVLFAERALPSELGPLSRILTTTPHVIEVGVVSGKGADQLFFGTMDFTETGFKQRLNKENAVYFNIPMKYPEDSESTQNGSENKSVSTEANCIVNQPDNEPADEEHIVKYYGDVVYQGKPYIGRFKLLPSDPLTYETSGPAAEPTSVDNLHLSHPVVVTSLYSQVGVQLQHAVDNVFTVFRQNLIKLGYSNVSEVPPDVWNTIVHEFRGNIVEFFTMMHHTSFMTLQLTSNLRHRFLADYMIQFRNNFIRSLPLPTPLNTDISNTDPKFIDKNIYHRVVLPIWLENINTSLPFHTNEPIPDASPSISEIFSYSWAQKKIVTDSYLPRSPLLLSDMSTSFTHLVWNQCWNKINDMAVRKHKRLLQELIKKKVKNSQKDTDLYPRVCEGLVEQNLILNNSYGFFKDPSNPPSPPSRDDCKNIVNAAQSAKPVAVDMNTDMNNLFKALNPSKTTSKCRCTICTTYYSVMNPHIHFQDGVKVDIIKELPPLHSLVDTQTLHLIQSQLDTIAEALITDRRLYNKSIEKLTNKVSRHQLKYIIARLFGTTGPEYITEAAIPTDWVTNPIIARNQHKRMKDYTRLFARTGMPIDFVSRVKRYQQLLRLHGISHKNKDWKTHLKNSFKNIMYGQIDSTVHRSLRTTRISRPSRLMFNREKVDGTWEFVENTGNKHLRFRKGSHMLISPLTRIGQYERDIFNSIDKLDPSHYGQVTAMLGLQDTDVVSVLSSNRVNSPTHMHVIVRELVMTLIDHEQLYLMTDIAPLFRRLMLQPHIAQFS